MKKFFFVFLALFSALDAQVSSLDIENIKNEQLDLIRSEMKDLQVTGIDDVTVPDFKEVTIVPGPSKKVSSEFFGYDYFTNDVSFIDNMPPPADFRLGPGDEIVISMWGDITSRETYTLNREGNIFYDKIGFINLSGMTIFQAEEAIVSKLSSIYSTLSSSSPSTQLDVELGKVLSMNIYFSGEVLNPGLHLIHPFSDIFVALISAGGVANSGSLRNIEIIRNSNVVETVDLYSFFTDGKSNFSKLKLVDGDVIHVPVVEKRVEIKGSILKPSKYELLPNEFIEDLINFSGGLTPNASSLIVLDRTIPLNQRSSDDNATTSMNIDYKNSSLISLENGDIINIKPIGFSQSKVRVFGKVKNPGEYSAMNSSLKDILDFAGGFNDPLFRKSINNEIIILRLDENQFYAQEYKVEYKDSAAFIMNPGDKIFVYENTNYNRSYTYSVEGEVNRPGRYPFQKGITIQDAIATAGGLTEMSNFSNIVILQEFSEVDDDGNIIITSNSVANASLDFEIADNTLIKALPVENVINVSGNVYNPGLISYSPGMTMYDAIEMAGGYKPYSLKNRAYVIRANGEREKANIFRGRAKRIFAGDSVFIPVNPNPSDFDITTFIADLSSTLANIAAILIIVDNNN
ncbi:MAG: SLBB domain-containing protein [Candidatus Neomarinimicrobiota bacterium]|nr:SLBB domain-containing protein [Candidatus Neomarinimicrobiota bacterium]